MAGYVDRYSQFRVNGGMKPLPGITIPESSTDLSYVYKQGVGRLDKISNMYYNNAWSGWLIMAANPQFGGLEFNIPDMTLIRVPYPFDSAVERYTSEIRNHKVLYGE
jgi:gentisate 1,2-dioxygenase